MGLSKRETPIDPVGGCLRESWVPDEREVLSLDFSL